MSTIEDFKNAPIGATATTALGSRAMKINDGGQRWITPSGNKYNDGKMAFWNYILDPFEPAPATAREALDLAWELAHPIREGQIIPAGTDYLVSRNGERPATMRANLDQFASKSDETNRRTLEPLPDPEPDWLDAPAVLASHPLCADTERIGIWLPSLYKDGMWELPVQQGEFRVHWSELENVSPLYPKGQDA